MGAEFISISSDMEEIKNAFAEVKEYTKYLERDVLQEVGRGTVRAIKAAYPFRRKGDLYRSVKSKLTKDKKGVYVTSYAASDKNVRYGWVLARGATIKPKSEKVLTFQVDGKWRRSHSVLLRAHDWIAAPGRAYIGSQAFEDDIEKVINRKIEQLKKKGVLK